MQQIGSVLGRVGKMIPSTSTLPPGTATLAEALQAGVSTDAAPIECEFCGELLQPVGLLITGLDEPRWLRSDDDYEDCACPDAVKQREDTRKEKEAAQRIERERAYREKVDRMIKNSRLGKRFWSRTFETYRIDNRNKPVYETVKRYAENFAEHKERGEGLYLSGGFGTGKTHLAAAVCHEVIRQGYQPIFGTMITLLERIKATYSGAEETERQIIDRYINCDLLIVDDLGKERPTSWALEKLYEIINARYEDCRPVVITSNYDIKRLEERLAVGDNAETAGAIASRLYEVCRGVPLTWGDVRKTRLVKELNNFRVTGGVCYDRA